MSATPTRRAVMATAVGLLSWIATGSGFASQLDQIFFDVRAIDLKLISGGDRQLWYLFDTEEVEAAARSLLIEKLRHVGLDTLVLSSEKSGNTSSQGGGSDTLYVVMIIDSGKIEREESGVFLGSIGYILRRDREMRHMELNDRILFTSEMATENIQGAMINAVSLVLDNLVDILRRARTIKPNP